MIPRLVPEILPCDFFCDGRGAGIGYSGSGQQVGPEAAAGGQSPPSATCQSVPNCRPVSLSLSFK